MSTRSSVLYVAALLAAAVLACEEQRRVPYIPPTLHNWQQPYEGTARLELHVFRTGALRLPPVFAPLRGGSGKERERPVLSFVLVHPRKGLVVIDTGLNRRIAERSSNHLGGLLGMSVKAELGAEEHLPAQMQAAGLDPARVKTVVVSNLRFQHAGELEAFRNAVVVVSKQEHRQALAGAHGYVRREFDDVEHWELVDVRRNGRPLGTLQAALDLFGDGSLFLIDAAGPTEGNLAFLVRLPDRAVVLAGDLAPTVSSVRHAARPASLADPDAWWDHIWRLKRFRDLEPALLVVPGSSTEPLEEAALTGVHVHEYRAPGATPTP